MLTRSNPLNERLRQLHMLALYRNGQQADALQVYREVHELLVSELGIEPGGELRALQDRILHADPELDGPNRPPGQSVSRVSRSVPEDDGDTPRTATSEERQTPLQSFLAARLRAARERTFVGRDTERAMFASMLAGAEHGFAAMYLHGPAGIGKSALLRQFADDAAAAGRRVVPVSGKVIGASVAAFTDAAAPALSNPRAVLMIDAFERCADLEGWLREQFLPRLPDGVPVAVAGRQPPEPAWRVDPSWSGALLVHRLGDLSVSEADHLVESRGLAADVRESVRAFGGGQPLALSLAAETARGCVSPAGSGGRTADVRQALLTELIEATPSFYHRVTLYVAAHAQATGERLIRAAVPCSGSVNADSTALFGWLRTQPFMIRDSKGLYYPNDMVRELLDDDFRSLDPITYKVMHDKIAAFELERLAGQEQSYPVDYPIRGGGRTVVRRSA